MLNRDLSDEKQLLEWRNSFDKAKPYRFLVIDNFLDPAFAEEIANDFPSLDEMNVNYKGINERKSEHSDFEKLPTVFKQLKERVSKPDVTTAIETITQISHPELINDRYGYGLHQGGRNSFLDIHVDYNLHPLEKKQRRLNMILFFNKEWKEEWGGALELWNKDVTVCEQAVLPVFNRCVLFECNEYSFHGYSRINCPEDVTRKSFYQYYFTEPQKKIIFHDTIFKSKPDESTGKKILVPVKEGIKNYAKRILYYLGWKRFLK